MDNEKKKNKDRPSTSQTAHHRQRANASTEPAGRRPEIRNLGPLLCFAAVKRVQAWRGVYHHITRDPNALISNTLNIQHLRQLTLGLATAATASGGPGEVSNRDDEEAVAVISQTSEGIVPSGERSQEAEETTSLDDGSGGGAVGADQVADTQQQEGQIQEEEQQEEGNGRAEGAEEQDGGEDEPAHEEQTHRVIEEVTTAILLERGHNLEAARSQDDSESDPETTVRGQSSGTESVSDSHFPGERQISIDRAVLEFLAKPGQFDRIATTYHIPASSWTRPP